MKLDFSKLNKNTVIWCDTEEKAKEFITQAYKNKYKWVNHISGDENNTYWNTLKENVCYRIDENEITFADKFTYKNAGHPIIPFDDLIIKEYPIVVLCGSTKFKNTFERAQKDFTLKGYIVLSVGLFGHSGDNEVWTDDNKKMLDDMHKEKIRMADEVIILNVDGYIGESTRNEIEYAKELGKKITYLEPLLELTEEEIKMLKHIKELYPSYIYIKKVSYAGTVYYLELTNKTDNYTTLQNLKFPSLPYNKKIKIDDLI